MVPWFPVLERLEGMPCAGGKFIECQHDREKCRRHAREFRGVKWETCPVREAMDDPTVKYVLDLDEAAQVSPIADWPRNRPVWLVQAMLTLRRERALARAFIAKHFGGKS